MTISAGARQAYAGTTDLSPTRSSGSRRWPQTLCLVILCLGFGVISALIGGTRLIFSLPAYLILGVMGLAVLASIRVRKPAPSQLCLLTSGLFFGYILGRAYFSPVVYLMREDAFAVLGCLLVYLTVACALTDTHSRLGFICFLLVIAMIQAGVGAIQFKYGNNFMLIPSLQRFNYGARASGLYVCPNHLAGFLEVVGLFGLGALCWGRLPRWGRLLLGYLTGICYLGLALTVSRAGYLGAGVGFLVFLVVSLIVLFRAGIKRFWNKGIPALIAAICLAAGVIFLANESFFISFRTQDTVDDTNDVRFDLWQAAWQQAKLDPAWGTGSGTYLYYGRQFRSERVQEDPIEAHNDYLQLLAEYGWIGIAGFAVFLTAHLYQGWVNIRRLGPRRSGARHLFSSRLAIQIAAFASVAAYIVHSIFDFNLHIPANALLLAFVFGLIANPGLDRDEATGWRWQSLAFWRLVSIGVGGFVIVQCVRLLPGEYFAEKSRVALRDHQPDLAADYALKGLVTEHQNPDLYYYLAHSRIVGGGRSTDEDNRQALFQSAIPPIEDALRLAPRDVYYRVELALIDDALNRFDQAEAAFQRALELDPRSLKLRQDYEAHQKRWRESEEGL